MLLPNNAWVVIADGRKHVVLKNCGDPDLPDLRVHQVETRRAEKNVDAGSDRPGRVHIRGARRAAVEETDWKKLGEADFAAKLAANLNRETESGGLRHFLLIADPRTLGEMRRHLTEMTKGRLLSEIPGDLTHEPVDRIEQRIMAI